jgi:hypothetical protein
LQDEKEKTFETLNVPTTKTLLENQLQDSMFSFEFDYDRNTRSHDIYLVWKHESTQ